MTTYDAIVIGAGHNGLTAAATLARRGKSVLVLEANKQVGGLCNTREFVPGFKVSSASHLLYGLHPSLYRNLRLRDFGLQFAAQRMSTVVLNGEGDYLNLFDDTQKTFTALAVQSDEDANSWLEFQYRMLCIARVLQKQMHRIPPRIGSGLHSENLALGKIAWDMRRLGRDNMRELLRIIGMNMADLVEENFKTDMVRGVLCFDAVLGSKLGPRSPNTVLTWLHRMAGLGSHKSRLSLPMGGMGALSEALANVTKSLGSDIRVDTPVKKIVVDDEGFAKGVLLENGEYIESQCVISNADPKKTFLDMVGVSHLDTGFVRRVQHLTTEGVTAKLNIALDGMPTFRDIDPDAMQGRIVFAPDVDTIERAFNASKYGEYSKQSVFELTIPTLHDKSLAPEGKHVMSVIVQYAPANLKQGWTNSRESYLQHVMNTLQTHIPNLQERVIDTELLTPLDLQQQFGVTGGHWHHAELGLDRFLMLRPIPGFAQYATPVDGLYLCGAGCHPGGHVMGAAGVNAANVVLDYLNVLEN